MTIVSDSGMCEHFFDGIFLCVRETACHASEQAVLCLFGLWFFGPIQISGCDQ